MPSPLRSEAAMFRVVVIAVAAAAPVIALGLIAGPSWAVAALVLELVACAVILWRRRSRRATRRVSDSSGQV